MSLTIVKLAHSARGVTGRMASTAVLKAGQYRQLGLGTPWWHKRLVAAFSTATQPEVAGLPRLPVPPLQLTLQKYLRSVKPLVTEQEYEQTVELVKGFGGAGKLGDKLQFLLEEKARKTENWLSEWWLNSAYLDYRWPVVVYSSPGLVFPLQKFHSKDDQLSYAAKLIAGALDYKQLIDENAIPAERMGTKMLDMSQYSKVLSTCRIPGVTRDAVYHYGMDDSPPDHIVVAHNNHFFKMTVYGSNGEVIPENQILEQLRDIVSHSPNPCPPVGVLTTENRDVWGKAYKKLKKEKQNHPALEEIQRSIFLVCIDQPNRDLGAPNKQTASALQMIHGGGSKYNSGNRWYDKTIQFIVGADGEVGLTCEHSPADGLPVVNLLDHIVNSIASGSKGRQASRVSSPPSVHLKLKVTNEMEEEIKIAERDLDILIKDLEISCFTFKAYGTQFIKSQKMSPDSFIQMAIQLAYYRLHGEPGACYESASTRQYLHGRTETIRSTSIEAVDFCKAMLGSVPDKTKVQALKGAIDSHKKYALEAVNGFGVDRHLLGLKLIAIENGLDVPEVFLDTSYNRSSHYKIATSQVPAKCDAFIFYGPLVPDGYACCYNPRTNDINFGISASNCSPQTCSGQFREALEQSLVDMHDILLRTQPSKL